MSKIKITNIELQIGKSKFKLSLDEARELKKILNDTFPSKEVVYINPIYVEEYKWPVWKPYDIWCGTCSTDSHTLCLATNYTE